MRRIALLAAAAAMASCTPSPYLRSEGLGAAYYEQPADRTSSKVVDRKEIRTWTDDPRLKRRLGYLYQEETRVGGTRDTREGWVIFNDTGSVRLGMISGKGVLYRFDGNGRLGQPLGEYPLLMGLKIFFGLPLSHNLELEEPDPYR